MTPEDKRAWLGTHGTLYYPNHEDTNKRYVVGWTSNNGYYRYVIDDTMEGAYSTLYDKIKQTLYIRVLDAGK